MRTICRTSAREVLASTPETESAHQDVPSLTYCSSGEGVPSGKGVAGIATRVHPGFRGRRMSLRGKENGYAPSKRRT